MKIVKVTFGGKPAEYEYTATIDQVVNVVPTDRVVVTTGCKADGSLSLTIATVMGIEDAAPRDISGLKPIVQFVDAKAYREAQLRVLVMEKAAVPVVEDKVSDPTDAPKSAS